MKTLILCKKKSKSSVFEYQVLDDNGKVIATRKSRKEYVACYVVKVNDSKFAAPYFFSRMDLIGKGDSRYFTTSPNAYGIAYLKTENEEV
jgi:hypothetical protein